MTKAPPKRPGGPRQPGSRSTESVARVERHLQIAAADEILKVDGVALPLRPPRRKSARLFVLIGVPLVVLGGLASLFIVPTRSWLNQRSQYGHDSRKLEAVQAANQKLEEQIAALQTDEEIVRIARARYNLVRNGDQVMAVLPSPAPYPLPNEWPYTVLQDIVTVRLDHPETMPGHAPVTTVKPSAATADPILTEAPAATEPVAETSETTTPA